MRSALVTLAALAVVVVSTSSTRAAAEPVRVAVVGFTGDLGGEELSALAGSVRASLSRQADPSALIVVTREEMSLVYRQRGAPCRPDDVPCVLEASDAWQGRLFVRGVVRKASDGVIVGATLESVHGALVATAQTPPSRKYDMGVAVPILVRELLDGEKAYRTRMLAAAGGTADPGPVHCRCRAIESTAVAGELVADDGGVRFEAAPNSGRAVSWRYDWNRIASITPAAQGANPAIRLESTTKDALSVYFEIGGERDTCLQSLARKRLAHQR